MGGSNPNLSWPFVFPPAALVTAYSLAYGAARIRLEMDNWGYRDSGIFGSFSQCSHNEEQELGNPSLAGSFLRQPITPGRGGAWGEGASPVRGRL